MVKVSGRVYSTAEVAEKLDVTFRMLDHYLRRGHVYIASEASGSGSRRKWTHREVEALRVCLNQVREAQELLDAFARGELWRQALEEVHDG